MNYIASIPMGSGTIPLCIMLQKRLAMLALVTHLQLYQRNENATFSPCKLLGLNIQNQVQTNSSSIRALDFHAGGHQYIYN